VAKAASWPSTDTEARKRGPGEYGRKAETQRN